MSLITLTSGDSQKPYLFSSHFPQPIHIPTGSQVCMLKFLHFRNEDEFIVNGMNNRLYFCIGNTKTDGKRPVILTTGSYTGADLALQLQTQMNAVLQQQNFVWSCVYSKINDNFTISYASVTTPSNSGGTWTDYVNDDSLLEIKNNDVTGGKSTIIPKLNGDFGEPDDVTAFLRKGILIHSGLISTESVGFRVNNTEMTDTSATYTPSFNDTTLGIVRDVISIPSPENLNVNSKFDPKRQDIRIDLLEDGVITCYSIDNTSQTNPSKPNFANIREMRQLPVSVLQNITGFSLADKNKVINTYFRVIISLHRTASNTIQIIAQLQWSQDRGGTYVSAVSTKQDASANNYIRSYTTSAGTALDGVFWVSNEANFNDGGSEKLQILQTKRCPYVPTITSYDDQNEFGSVSLTTGDSQVWTGASEDYTVTTYSGVNDFDFVLTSTSKVWYVRDPLLTLGVDITTFKISLTDSAAPTLKDATYNANDGKLNLDAADAGGEDLVYQGTALPKLSEVFPQYLVEGVLNGTDRPVAVALNGEDVTEGSGTLVGADLSQKAMLWLRRLDADDILANSGTPAYLKSGDDSGNLGLILGSAKNFVITSTSSTGQDVFVSGATPDRVAKSTTLHISIPELPIKSYNGAYSGIGKNLCMIPREEFKGQGANSGRLVYVSDFENWLDLDTATDLNLNMFTVEVRNPDSSLATDLSPDTTLQIKFREDPTKIHKELSALMKNSLQRTGQILSQELTNLGS